MESTTFRGIWWPEGEPENQIAGTLQYNPGTLSRLNLIGDFSDGFTGSSTHVSYEKVLGVTEDGEAMTLTRCERDSRSRRTSRSASFVSSDYVVRFIIAGYAFDGENPAFDSISLSFYGMNQWARLSSPSGTVDMDNPPTVNPGDEFRISFPVPRERIAWIRQSRGVPFDHLTNFNKISVGARATSSIDDFEEGQLTIRHRFRIDPNRPRVPLEEYLDHIETLRNFVSLGLRAPAYPNVIDGAIEKPSGERFDIKLYFSIPGPPQKDFGHPLRRLFNLPDIDLSQALPIWYRNTDRYEDAVNLYFGALYNEEMYPQNQFIGICHALESYHRERFGGQYIDDGTFEDLYEDMASILSGSPDQAYTDLAGSDNLKNRYSLPDDFIDSMKGGTLAYMYEYSLRRRIEEISDARRVAISGLPYSILGKESLAANTRNYFSHYTEELKEKAALGKELQELLWGVQQLLEACLLSELGISDSVINDRLESCYSNRWVR